MDLRRVLASSRRSRTGATVGGIVQVRRARPGLRWPSPCRVGAPVRVREWRFVPAGVAVVENVCAVRWLCPSAPRATSPSRVERSGSPSGSRSAACRAQVPLSTALGDAWPRVLIREASATLSERASRGGVVELLKATIQKVGVGSTPTVSSNLTPSAIPLRFHAPVTRDRRTRLPPRPRPLTDRREPTRTRPRGTGRAPCSDRQSRTIRYSCTTPAPSNRNTSHSESMLMKPRSRPSQ